MGVAAVFKKLLMLLAVIVGMCVTRPAYSTQYYLSPTGLDSNPGTSTGSPWLTPNHALNCGDVITAAAGTYSSSNFQNNKWGKVTCPSANNVAWLTCATFDACKVSSTSSDAMWISQSFWGITGWEATTTSTNDGACFHIGPTSGIIHHIILANDVANVCQGSGLDAYDVSTSSSVDYISFIGNIAYNTSNGNLDCYSGVGIYQPIASDTNAGTHNYAAQNFTYANVDGTSCDSAGAGKTTDGEGINFDTWDFSQGGGTPYTQQGAIENNIEFLNGGDGIEVENNSAGSTHAPIYIEHNTMYGSRRDPNSAYCLGNGELDIYNAFNVTAEYNLIYTGFANGLGNCASDPIYSMVVGSGNSTDTVDYNFASGVSGNNTYTDGAGGFAFGSHNVIGTNPEFANAVNPGAPSCGSYANAVACAAGIIANFVPSAGGASTYGYQPVSSTSITDALFPQWLCNGHALIAGFPSGIVTPGCGVASGTCPVNASMTQSQIQSVISACVNSQTVTWAAGTYNITSTLNVPCGVNQAGPTVALLPYNPGDGWTRGGGVTPTATIQGSLGRTAWLMTLASCTSAQSITYLAFNGEQPAAYGGGGIYVPAGNSNLTISYNYLHGNQTTGTTCCGAAQDSLIYLDGNNPANNDMNVTITWNRFGATGDCSNIMTNVSGTNYQGSTAAETGGYCAGIGIHTGATNLNIANNDVYYQEEGIKHYSGTSNTTSFCNLCTIDQNDWSTIHRIALETQINPGAGSGTGSGSAETIEYNSYHDDYYAFYGAFGISAANGTSGETNATYNMLIGNNCPISPATAYAMADELWGNLSTSSNNWFEGCFDNAIQYNYIANFTIDNNFNCGTGGNGGTGLKYVNDGVPGYVNTPTLSGNTPGPANTINAVGSTTCAAIASTTPSISPASGSESFPLTVTLTDSGANTGIWYTTDNSTPVPGTGTAQYYTGPFTLPAAGTVKAVGMWGALNQPVAYPSGYGFTPSPAVSATYTGGGTPTVATPVFTPGAQTFGTTLSVSVSTSTAGATLYCTTNGTTPTTSSPVYSTPFTVSVTTTIRCLGALAGYTNSNVATAVYTYSLYLGNNVDSTAGTTTANYFNDVYAVTGSSSGGYTVNSGVVCFAPGTVTSGKGTDIGINTAPTATTQGTSAICHGTYTTTSATSPGCVTIPLTGCGTLAATTPYWLWTITNDPLSNVPLYFSNCGSSCNSTVPTGNVGTYGGFYLAGTYGTYTGMSSSFTGGPGAAQPSVYLFLSANASAPAATPVLTPGTQTFNPNLSVTITDSTPGAAIYYTTNGTTPTTASTHYTGAISLTSTTTINAIAVATGYAQSAVGTATYTLGSPTISQVYLNVPGNTFLNYVTVGGTVQFAANVVYSDGVELTSTVVGVANTRGDSISSWTTSASGIATISTSGILTGVAVGRAIIQAVIDGTVNSSQWYEYVSKSASTQATGITTQGVSIQ